MYRTSAVSRVSQSGMSARTSYTLRYLCVRSRVYLYTRMHIHLGKRECVCAGSLYAYVPSVTVKLHLNGSLCTFWTTSSSIYDSFMHYVVYIRVYIINNTLIVYIRSLRIWHVSALDVCPSISERWRSRDARRRSHSLELCCCCCCCPVHSNAPKTQKSYVYTQKHIIMKLCGDKNSLMAHCLSVVVICDSCDFTLW